VLFAYVLTGRRKVIRISLACFRSSLMLLASCWCCLIDGVSTQSRRPTPARSSKIGPVQAVAAANAAAAVEGDGDKQRAGSAAETGGGGDNGRDQQGTCHEDGRRAPSLSPRRMIESSKTLPTGSGGMTP